MLKHFSANTFTRHVSLLLVVIGCQASLHNSGAVYNDVHQADSDIEQLDTDYHRDKDAAYQRFKLIFDENTKMPLITKDELIKSKTTLITLGLNHVAKSAKDIKEPLEMIPLKIQYFYERALQASNMKSQHTGLGAIYLAKFIRDNLKECDDGFVKLNHASSLLIPNFVQKTQKIPFLMANQMPDMLITNRANAIVVAYILYHVETTIKDPLPYPIYHEKNSYADALLSNKEYWAKYCLKEGLKMGLSAATSAYIVMPLYAMAKRDLRHLEIPLFTITLGDR